MQVAAFCRESKLAIEATGSYAIMLADSTQYLPCQQYVYCRHAGVCVSKLTWQLEGEFPMCKLFSRFSLRARTTLHLPSLKYLLKLSLNFNNKN